MTAVSAVMADLTGNRIKTAILFAIGLLFTSNIVACVPEAYGLSFGVLSLTAWVTWSSLAPRHKAAWLAGLTVLGAGTTITDGLYPLGALTALLLRAEDRGGIRPSFLTPERLRVATALLALAALGSLAAVPLVLPVVERAFPNLYGHLTGWLHLRLIREPVLAVQEWGKMLVYPAVGPYPQITLGSVTFDVASVPTWTWVHIGAAVAWSGALVWGAAQGFADRVTRGFTLGLLVWVAFHLGLHAIWGGPDNILYAPHWSWALMILVALGARQLPVWVVLGFGLVIVPAQVMTLVHTVREIGIVKP